MGNFLIALKITGGNEGGYNNSPADHGGETYAGISRNNWPAWHGWSIIDSTKKNAPLHSLSESLAGNSVLQGYIHDFYKQNFWDVNSLDLVKDQKVANNIYDCGVNNGTGYAAKTLQGACNSVSVSNGLHIPQLTIDGNIGAKTIDTANIINPQDLYNEINSIREDRYKQLAVGNQAQFLHSWLSRLVPYKL